MGKLCVSFSCNGFGTKDARLGGASFEREYFDLYSAQ